jgi:hypothetical protein
MSADGAFGKYFLARRAVFLVSSQCNYQSRFRCCKPCWTRACLLNIRLRMFEAGWMVRAHVVSDELWSVIEPVVATAGGPAGPALE